MVVGVPAYLFDVAIQASYVDVAEAGVEAEAEAEAELAYTAEVDVEAGGAYTADVRDLAAFGYHWELILQMSFGDNACTLRWETQLC